MNTCDYFYIFCWMKEMIFATLSSLSSRSDASSISSGDTPSSFALFFRSFHERDLRHGSFGSSSASFFLTS